MLAMVRGWLGWVGLTLLAGCTDSATEPGGPVPITDERGLVPPLVCPGSSGCTEVAGALRVGAGAVAVTPTVEPFTDTNDNGQWDDGEPFEDFTGNGAYDPVWLAGFGNGRAAASVHDDVWARALVLEQGDLRIGMVVLDLVGLFHPDVIAIRQAAAERGLDLDHVMVSTTHNHEAGDTMGIWGSSVAETGYDPAYVATVIAGSAEALQIATEALGPAVATVAQAEAPELVNDTREPFVVDQPLTAIRFDDPDDGTPRATAVFWGNHPEALGSRNTALTSDFPHYLREDLEARYPDAPALYFNGSLGGLSTTIGIVGCPDADGEDTCPQGTFERAEYVGRGAAAAAIDALETRGAVVDGDLGLRRQGFLVATTNARLALAFAVGLLPRTVHEAATGAVLPADAAQSIVLADLLGGTYLLQSELNVIRLGGVSIATVPGELYPELWLQAPDGGHYQEAPDGRDDPDAPFLPPIQSMLDATTEVPVIINNANDAIGYVIPPSQWDERAPFAYVDEGDDAQYGEENSIGAGTAQTVADTFAEMMRATP